MKWREIPMPGAKYGVKCPYTMTPEFIVIHNTANDASAENEIRYMQSNDNTVSFHFAVDDREAVLGVPLNRNTWNAGDGASGRGNRRGISIEICYSKSGGARFDTAERNAAMLCAELMARYGWGIDAIKKHQDFSGKRCPHRTLDLGWERFINLVRDAVANSRPDEYAHDGLKFVRAKSFRIVYHDADKRSGSAARYINGGFFGNYRSSGVLFSLPVANLVCDSVKYKAAAEKYLAPFTVGGKLILSCNHNQSRQFNGKRVSTLIVPYSGAPYIDDVNEVPKCKYAISGVPTVRNFDDVDYYGYVKAQGWDDSCMRPTYRNWLGVRDGEIWIISGKTKTANYIYGMEIWNKLKEERFSDVICLDGGSSYYRKCGGVQGWGVNSVNNLVEF